MEEEWRKKLMKGAETIAQLFIKEAIKTENVDFNALINRISNPKTIRLLHATMGIVTEAGELMDAMKKHIIYGTPLDEVNLKEELGDLNWYEALMHDVLGSTFEEIQIKNIQKLRKRYASRFNSSEAVNRDLKEERSELEKKIDLAAGYNMGAKKPAENLSKDEVCSDSNCSYPFEIGRNHKVSDHFPADEEGGG
jgi:NTP pyrophosphatase (non-canonical NTP hydrolase)